jgi:hypothetical protein
MISKGSPSTPDGLQPEAEGALTLGQAPLAGRRFAPIRAQRISLERSPMGFVVIRQAPHRRKHQPSQAPSSGQRLLEDAPNPPPSSIGAVKRQLLLQLPSVKLQLKCIADRGCSSDLRVDLGDSRL